jgi:hypothetical protein
MFRRRRIPAAPWLAMVGIAVFPARAAGDAPGVALEWSAPAGCPDGEAVRRRIETLAGPGVAVGARAVVTEAPDGYHIALEVRAGGMSGERDLIAPTCEAAAESIAAIVGLAATAGVSPPATTPTRSPAAPPAPSPPPTTPAPRSQGPEFRVTPEAALDVGTLPTPAPGAALRVELAFDRITAGVTGALWLHRDGYLSGSTTQGAHFALQSYDAFGCYALVRAAPVDLSPCIAVEIAAMAADGFGATLPQSYSGAWVAIGVGARVRIELGRHFALALGLQGVVPTIPQQFRINGTPNGSVFGLSPVAGRAEVGPEVRF